MKTILGFVYNGSNYYVVDEGTVIFLGKYANNAFIPVPDTEKADLRNIIKLLLVENFNKQSLLELNITILDTNVKIKDGISNAIILELKETIKANLIKNCKEIYKEKNSKKFKKVSLIVASILAVVIVIFVIFNIVMSFVKSYEAKKEMLESYTYVRDESLSDFYNMKYQVVNITTKESDNLFNDNYVSFENPYSNALASIHYDISFTMNSYHGDPSLDIVYDTDTYENNFETYDMENINYTYNVSVEEVFEKNNVNNYLDLIYNVVLNSEKEITTKSSEEEMKQHLVFEIFRPLVIPYNQDSTQNELIFFTGDKYGYAHITDNEISIVLKNETFEYELIYKYSDGSTKLTNEQIINIVSTLNFN